MDITYLIQKSRQAEAFTKQELVWMLELPPDAPESYMIMAEGKRVAAEACGGKAEVHAQFSLNLSPCPKNCKYCSFAAINKVFDKPSELTLAEAVDSALVLEKAGANAVYMMATANYDFGKLLEVSQEVRRALRPETPLVANVGDRTTAEAQAMKDAGIDGVYHAIRLREGTDTAIDPAKRHESFRAFAEAGLGLGTCVEPVGPEHTNEELAEMILLTGSLGAVYSGAGRRISIPGTEMAERHGMISELRQAQCVAVTRIGVPRGVPGNCTHEPCTIGAAAGASLLWAEIGANPRDITEHTEAGRGQDVLRLRQIYWEAGVDVLDGPSRYYGAHNG